MSSSSARSRRSARCLRRSGTNTLAGSYASRASVISAEERVEFAKRLGQRGPERLERVGLAGVEAGFFRGALVGERRQRFRRLADPGPAQRALVAVVVRRVDALGLALDARDRLDRAAVLGGDA